VDGVGLSGFADVVVTRDVTSRSGWKGLRSSGSIWRGMYQVHGVGADGAVVVRRQLRRGQVLAFFASLALCLVGMEACASTHHWARELMALGHQVRLMPPAYVKAYVKRGKTDAADAEAIAEAVTRPTMRFVAVKSKAQQAALILHKPAILWSGNAEIEKIGWGLQLC
jgi:hypothetical protein